jgi:short-subunit dehydrogenase
MFQKKALRDQVIVITGASSGIGLATAKAAAKAGAKVVLASRNEEALQKIEGDLKRQGAQVTHLAVDVSDENAVKRLAQHATTTFGQVDTWVNDAAAAMYAELTEVSMADHRRAFDVNYWGTVYGSLAAVEAMKERGGTLVNMGSILSDIPIPLQGPYVATKHAVKGFTDTLRIELANKGVPVAVTLIKPASIETPYPDHAKNYMAETPVLPPPHYAPEVVARAILYAAEHYVRELYVGGAGRLMVLSRAISPFLYDLSATLLGYRAQKAGAPSTDRAGRRDNLYAPKQDGATRGLTAAITPTREMSVYTEMQMHPVATAVFTAATGLAALALLAPRPRRLRHR